MTTLNLENEHFKSLGAVTFHDSHYPANHIEWGGITACCGLFSRHYFDKNDLEIGLVIPDLFSCGGGVQVFDTKRIWGIPRILHPIHLA